MFAEVTLKGFFACLEVLNHSRILFIKFGFHGNIYHFSFFSLNLYWFQETWSPALKIVLPYCKRFRND
jgi:hypothetical protein